MRCFISPPTASSLPALKARPDMQETGGQGREKPEKGMAAGEGGSSRKQYRSRTGITIQLSSAPVFLLARPHLPLPKRAQRRPGAVGKALAHSSWQKWRWMARELLGVEWGWSSTTILSPSPLSTAPSPGSSQCRPSLLAASSPGRDHLQRHRHLLYAPCDTLKHWFRYPQLEGTLVWTVTLKKKS